ncbi:MAG: ABC transporter ATP-binding protein [Candidatus Eiseniibacteriota bacterium]
MNAFEDRSQNLTSHPGLDQAGIFRPDSASSAAPEAGQEAGTEAVRVEGLGKDFRHPWTRRLKTAVHEVSFTVPEGSIFGLLGPNGAGKTTTLRLLLGLLPATRGEAFLLGRPAGTPESRQDVGYLPENPYFYDHLSALEFLEYSGELAGLVRASARHQAVELLERVGLAGSAHVRMRKYSKGMLQRAGLAHALMGRPRLLFLDEPMTGLDPIGRHEVLELLRELRREGVTVVFSSHILPDVEALCDRVAILRAGRLQAAGTLESLLERGTGSAEIVVRPNGSLALPPEFLGVALEPLGPRVRLSLEDSSRASALVGWLATHGHEVLSVTRERRSLEDLFVELFHDAHEAGGEPEKRPGLRWRKQA